MGGVALRFCLVLGRVLMVVYCCGSGCFGCICVVLRLVLMVVCRCGSGGLGCIWRHLSWSLPWRCNFFFSSLRPQKATLGTFRGWCGAAFLSGFGACSDGGLLLRKRLRWMHLRGFEACSDGGVPLRKRRPGMDLEASLLVVALAV